ncbi:unnamed protein product, partial [Amoebophrya sp. A25]|eukprot:GSA25T00014511001.1
MSRRGLELGACFHSIKESKKASLKVVLLMMDDRTLLDSNCRSSGAVVGLESRLSLVFTATFRKDGIK